jgi:hypothetical protein
MRFVAVIAVLFCAATQPAFGQAAEAPLMGSAATAEEAAADDTGDVSRVLVLGDAIGGGLGAGLIRLTQDGGRFDVSIRFNEESGLARPDVYSWPETLPKIFATNRYDVVVVLMGSNDRQLIRSANERLVFGSPAWTAAYNARLTEFLDGLTASGARVFWVAIPPMADQAYDKDMQAISELQRQQAEARGFTYLDFRAEFSDPDGSYTDTGTDETGAVRKLRGKDGISFFKAGNNKLAQLVLQAIESGSARPPGPRAAIVVEAPKPPGEERAVPIFGQNLAFGKILTIEPKDIRADAIAVAGGKLLPSAAFQAILGMTVAGSGAEKLLRKGEIAPVPPGRADDFSLPPATAAQ